MRRVFLTKHNLQLEPGVIAFIENIFDAASSQFKDEGTDVWDEPYVVEQLEKFVSACQGTGIGAPLALSLLDPPQTAHSGREDRCTQDDLDGVD